MRFLLDEDLAPRVAKIARGLGLEVVSVHEVGRRSLSDSEQLRFALQDERVIVTRNRDDYIELVVSSYEGGEPCPGVLIVPYSLPNANAERIAHALKRWADHQKSCGVVDFRGVDFLR